MEHKLQIIQSATDHYPWLQAPPPHPLKSTMKPHEAAKHQTGKEFQVIKNNGKISRGLIEHIKALQSSVFKNFGSDKDSQLSQILISLINLS